jgi:20S proteasome subunit alpha 6
MRIYFHTPPTADDSRPIQFSPQVTRKGKRKKEDDDEDEEVRSAPAPPAPGGNADGDDQLHVTPHVEGRASVAPSATETASEADWLMAAIAEGDADAEAYDDTQGGEDADGESFSNGCLRRRNSWLSQSALESASW